MPSLTNLKEKEPYFPASGHNNYAMSILIFLYDMFQLKYTNPRAYKHFNDVFSLLEDLTDIGQQYLLI